MENTKSLVYFYVRKFIGKRIHQYIEESYLQKYSRLSNFTWMTFGVVINRVLTERFDYSLVGLIHPMIIRWPYLTDLGPNLNRLEYRRPELLYYKISVNHGEDDLTQFLKTWKRSTESKTSPKMVEVIVM